MSITIIIRYLTSRIVICSVQLRLASTSRRRLASRQQSSTDLIVFD